MTHPDFRAELQALYDDVTAKRWDAMAHHAAIERAQAALAAEPQQGVPSDYINVIFDGPPGPDAGRFVEVETDDGYSINAGEWSQRPDGLWSLRIARHVVIGSGKQAWLRFPKGVTLLQAVERDWTVVAASGLYSSSHLVLCEQVTCYGGPRAGMFWEPLQLKDLPMVDPPQQSDRPSTL